MYSMVLANAAWMINGTVIKKQPMHGQYIANDLLAWKPGLANQYITRKQVV